MMLRYVNLGLISLTLCGCLSFLRPNHSDSSTPFRHQVKKDQLIIHSDFLLPSQHRLIEDLRVQRSRLNEKLKLPVTEEPIHIFLFSEEDKYHDFVDQRFPRYADRRAVFVETDIQLSVYAHWGDRVAEDLRHEISHGYLHAAISNLPLWLDEGLAEYFEVGRGRGGINQAHLDYLLAKIDLENWQPQLLQLEKLPLSASMTQADYAEAWAWVHFLLESESKSEIFNGLSCRASRKFRTVIVGIKNQS